LAFAIVASQQPPLLSVIFEALLMAAQVGQILVEDDDGLDSAYGGDDSVSETYTLQSSVREYIYANGRRYNSYQSGKYW
jgi:hypothetical protein